MLFDILSNRISVNILKLLYEKEKKKSYSTKIGDITGSKKDIEKAVFSLSSEGLIYNEDSILSISEKGKKFIDVFDKLVELVKQKEAPVQENLHLNNVEIIYDLSDFEKRILFVLFRVNQETGKDVPLSELTQELFPYEDAGRRKLRVSRDLAKLEQINLARKIKKERVVFAQITDSGLKVVKRQIIAEMKKVL